MAHNAVIVDPQDNVATLLVAVSAEAQVVCDRGSSVIAREEVPAGHKVALVPIPEGAVVRKYGHPIGTADRLIAAGDHVHTHNLAREAT
jgi:hypothetical protein